MQKITNDADPRRCQATTVKGQCMNVSANGTNYCEMHGGSINSIHRKKEDIKTYRLGRWQERVNQKASDVNLKTLREEIGILRIVLEEHLEACTNSYELMMRTHTISDLVSMIRVVVVACSKLDLQLQHTLDRAQVLEIAGKLVDIIVELIDDSDTVQQIVERFNDVIMSIGDEHENQQLHDDSRSDSSS